MTLHFLALDQGTTGTTALILKYQDGQVQIVGQSTENFQQHYPQNGWVEHDLDQIWESIGVAVSRSLLQAGLKGADLHGIGITNQRETLCFFDRKTGSPRRKSIVWQCRRSADICHDLQNEKDWVIGKTGLQMDPYFSASKLLWIAQHEPNLHKELQMGQTCASTIDAWMVHRLTGGVKYATEPSNASRTMLMDLTTCEWDEDLLRLFQVPQNALPEILYSADDYGQTQGLSFLPDGIPIFGVLGDQQAALLGQGAVDRGDLKCTYGTGAFALMNIGSDVKSSQNKLITTVAWSLPGQVTYALEGSSFIAGAGVQFIRDQLKWIQDASNSEVIAQKEQAAPHLFFVPALAGLGAPQWNADARGAFLGMSRATTSNQLVRAALEGIAFSVNDLMDALRRDAAPVACDRVRVDGGASKNQLLMQLQADISQIQVDCSSHVESTGLGAVFIALMGAGYVQDMKEFQKMRVSSQVLTPQKKPVDIKTWKSGWNRAVAAVELFAQADF